MTANAEHNRVVGALALDLGMISEKDLNLCWQQCQEHPGQDLSDLLVERGYLTPEEKPHLEFLTSHRRSRPSTEPPTPQGTPPSPSAGAMSPPYDPSLPTITSPRSLPGDALPPMPTQDLPGSTWRFERQRLHGAGGIGLVWQAHDRLLDREVALKELRPETALDPELARRFLDEARVTGQLQHPGIVPVYDLAPCPPGAQPFYAMRFVRGRTLSRAIADYHDHRRRGTSPPLERTALLNAFVAVCNAVAFAHSRGVLHRDIKGQNVVLGDFGEVVVLDWGLAKHLAQGTSGPEGPQVEPGADIPAASRTLPGQVLGTPYYMSPEQAAGRVDRIDQRSDVYSLGALLYEILTGRPPFAPRQTSNDSESSSLTELIRRLQEEVPTPPRQLVADAPAALDAVCCKALARNPVDRYPSAADLGQEVQRWLADEPVNAYPEPWPVRLARWARHHKMAVAALAAFLLASLAGLAVTTVLVDRERARTAEARDRAETHFREAQEAVDRYLTQVSEDRLLNEPNMQPLRKELLSIAQEFYDRFARERGDDPDSRHALGQALLKLARVSSQLGDSGRARERFGEAQAVFSALVQQYPTPPKYRHGLAQSHLGFGNETLKTQGPTASVEEHLTQARELWDALVTELDQREHEVELANAHNSLAVYFENAARATAPERRPALFDRAEAAQQRAITLWRRLAEAEPTVSRRQNDLAGAYNNLAIFYATTGRPKLASDSSDQALQVRQRLAEDHAHVLEYQVNWASAYNNRAVLANRQGQFPRAVESLTQAIRILERVVRRNPYVLAYQHQLAKAYFNLGNSSYFVTLETAGKARQESLQRSKEAYTQALELYERLAEQYPEGRDFAPSAAVTLSCLGDLLLDDSPREALQWYDRAIHDLERFVDAEKREGDVRRALANALWGRAEIFTAAGRFSEAVKDWDRAADIYAGDRRAVLESKRASARLKWAEELLATGAYPRAAAELDRLPATTLPAAQLGEAARIMALCVRDAAARKDLETDALAVRAVAWLRQAQQAGLFAQHRDAPVLELFRSIPALATREDVRQLLNTISRPMPDRR